MPAKGKSPSAPLRIAVAGTGEVARKNYLPFLAAQPGVALACHNRTAEKAVQAARECGGQAFPTIEALLAWKPDTVLVLTAETCRHETGTALIKLGAPRLFFEKTAGRRARPGPCR